MAHLVSTFYVLPLCLCCQALPDASHRGSSVMAWSITNELSLPVLLESVGYLLCEKTVVRLIMRTTSQPNCWCAVCPLGYCVIAVCQWLSLSSLDFICPCDSVQTLWSEPQANSRVCIYMCILEPSIDVFLLSTAFLHLAIAIYLPMVLEVLDGTLSKGVLAVIVSWITWKIVGHLFSRSPLDNIPGPTNSSFLKGMSTSWWRVATNEDYRAGNVDRLFDRHGWDFQDEIGEKYGPVVKLMGPLGVSSTVYGL